MNRGKGMPNNRGGVPNVIPMDGAVSRVEHATTVAAIDDKFRHLYSRTEASLLAIRRLMGDDFERAFIQAAEDLHKFTDTVNLVSSVGMSVEERISHLRAFNREYSDLQILASSFQLEELQAMFGDNSVSRADREKFLKEEFGVTDQGVEKILGASLVV